MSTAGTDTPVREMYPVEETLDRIGGISRTTFYKLVKDGHIKTVKLGRRTFVMAEEIERFLATVRDGASR